MLKAIKLFLIIIEIPISFCKLYKKCMNILCNLIYFVTHLYLFANTLVEKHVSLELEQGHPQKCSSGGGAKKLQVGT